MRQGIRHDCPGHGIKLGTLLCLSIIQLINYSIVRVFNRFLFAIHYLELGGTERNLIGPQNRWR